MKNRRIRLLAAGITVGLLGGTVCDTDIMPMQMVEASEVSGEIDSDSEDIVSEAEEDATADASADRNDGESAATEIPADEKEQGDASINTPADEKEQGDASINTPEDGKEQGDASINTPEDEETSQNADGKDSVDETLTNGNQSEGEENNIPGNEENMADPEQGDQVNEEAPENGVSDGAGNGKEPETEAPIQEEDQEETEQVKSEDEEFVGTEKPDRPEEIIQSGEGFLAGVPEPDEETVVRASYPYGYTESVDKVAVRGGWLDRRPLTKIEIANLYQDARASSTEQSFDIEPRVSAPYLAGRASAANRQSTLNNLNMYRRIAGLTPVRESEELSDEAQHGAVLLAAIDQLTHYPGKPADMDTDFFKIGYGATSSSNIGAGYRRMEDGIDGCIQDNSGSNLTTVGHRRWFLNPDMLYIGLGQAQASGGIYGRYYAYKVFDRSNEALNHNFVSWPSSGNFPTELVSVKLPWSVSLNRARYASPSLEDVTVTITNPAGEKEVFDKSSHYAGLSGNEKYFNVDTVGYGEGPCIICNFGGNYAAFTQPGTYQIKVTGLRSADTGEAVSIEYQTTMFNASEYAGRTAVTDAQYNTIEEFVERLYTKCLGRSSEAEGKLDWTMKLADHDRSGAETGYGFVFSDEYLKKETDNDVFLDMMYDVYLGRKADASGKEYWSRMLQQGVSRKFVFRGFAESAEYDRICSEYGIERGTVTLTDGRDLNAGATMFVYRLYEKALGRAAEEDGLNDWSGSVAKGEKSAQTVAQSFFHSEEFLNKRYDDRNFVCILYRTFMGREYDESGLAYWLDALRQGKSRDEVLEGFSNSVEFHEIMASYGLN